MSSLPRLMQQLALAAAFAAALAAPATAQTVEMDNRGIRLGPEDKLSPEERRAMEAREAERRRRAAETGDTAIDTFQGQTAAPPKASESSQPATGGTGPASETGSPPPQTPASEPIQARPLPAADDRERARAPAAPESTYEDLGAQADEDYLTRAIGAILETLTQAPKTVRIRYPDARRDDPPRSTTPAAPSAAASDTGWPRIPPGTALYGRAIYEINSEHAGPAVIELLAPPLAGAVATGRFEVARERLILRLSSLSWRGRAAPIDAWAVDLGTAGYGVGGEVDRHYFARVVLPAAIRFAEGYLSSRAEPERTVSIDGETIVSSAARPTNSQAILAGGAAAARTFGDVLLQGAPTRPTVRIPRNTELAVMFILPPGRASRPPAREANVTARPAPPAPDAGAEARDEQ